MLEEEEEKWKDEKREREKEEERRLVGDKASHAGPELSSGHTKNTQKGINFDLLGRGHKTTQPDYPTRRRRRVGRVSLAGVWT